MEMWQIWDRMEREAREVPPRARKRHRARRRSREKCPTTCPCLCHEGGGAVEHIGARCYGKTGGKSDWGPSASQAV